MLPGFGPIYPMEINMDAASVTKKARRGIEGGALYSTTSSAEDG